MYLKVNANNKAIFDCIKEDTKTVETRAATAKYQKLKAGEKITFSCAGEVFEKKVSKVTHFATTNALLKVYKPEDINPKISTKEGIEEMYRSFPGYEEKIEEFGIVALEFA